MRDTALSRYTVDGQLFDGRYRLLRLLSSEGGTADVWLAENCLSAEPAYSAERDEMVPQEGTGVLVAIKIYHPKNALDMDGEQTFRQEFRTIFSRHHANLVPTTDYSICDSLPYLVMPYCERGSAAALIGRLTGGEAIWRFIFDVASGLDYLHACRPPIVHQDIKPANILIDHNGRYCITDFGFSASGSAPAASYLEITSYGTQMYMAPERFDDSPDAEQWKPDPRCDIWSLGATVYQLITGYVPFGPGGGAAQEPGAAPPPLPHSVPRAVRRLIARCLAYSPSDRPTAAAVADEARRQGQRHRLRIALAALAIALAAAVATWVASAPAVAPPADPLSALTRSADSIVALQKQEVRGSAELDATLTLRRLHQARAAYSRALSQRGDTVTHAASRHARARLARLTPAIALCTEYRGICDTLALARRYDLPTQEATFLSRKASVVKRLKRALLRM